MVLALRRPGDGSSCLLAYGQAPLWLYLYLGYSVGLVCWDLVFPSGRLVLRDNLGNRRGIAFLSFQCSELMIVARPLLASCREIPILICFLSTSRGGRVHGAFIVWAPDAQRRCLSNRGSWPSLQSPLFGLLSSPKPLLSMRLSLNCPTSSAHFPSPA